MADYLKADVKAGAVILICLGLLIGLIFYIGGFKHLETSYEKQILADSAHGVGQSSIVTFSGVKVGEVKSIRILPETELKEKLRQLNKPGLLVDDIRVEMIVEVYSSVKLRTDSVAEIVGTGLVGDQTINLTPGTIGGPSLPLATPIVGVELTGFGKLQQGIGDVNFDILIPNVRQIVTNLSEASERIKATTVKVDELLGDLDRKNQISRMLDKTEGILGEIDGIITDSSGDIKEAANNFNQATLDLKNELKPTLVSLRSAVDSVNEVMDKNKKEIDSIVAEFKETAVNFNQFSTKVKKYPWTLIRKTKVDAEDRELFPQSAKVKLGEPEKKESSLREAPEEKDKVFFFF